MMCPYHALHRSQLVHADTAPPPLPPGLLNLSLLPPRMHFGGVQVKGLLPLVLETVGRVLLEDVADYYERAVKKAILEYRR